MANLQLAKQARKAALAGYGPAVGTGVVGLACSRVAETQVYKLAPGLFGVNDGVTPLSQNQRVARAGAKGVMLVGDGYLMTRRQPMLKAAGFGLAIGHAWHLLNDAGINV